MPISPGPNRSSRRRIIRATLAHGVVLSFWIAIASGAATARDAAPDPPTPRVAPALCELLDDEALRARMDGLLHTLLRACGRQDELGGVESYPGFGPTESAEATDSPVNDRSGEGGVSTTQSETSIAENPNTGTLCSAFNDSWELFGGGGGLTGFSRSRDAGATWDDRGPVGSNTAGDPAIAWSERDGAFYIATLSLSAGLELNVSTDDCRTFSFAGTPATGGDDKELIAVDNNPASRFFGRIYLAWIDFGAGARIALTTSDDGGATWSPQIALSGVGDSVQSAWPVVAPNGDVYVGWIHWINFPDGPIEIEIARSIDGGVSFVDVTPPMSGEAVPRDASWTGTCGRAALNGGIRYSPFPQLAISSDGALHAVYSYDPDGVDVGDIVNVYYRRSADGGATWGAEVQLNDDSTNDQYSPTLAVGSSGTVMATWYDRRLDPDNFLQDVFRRVSDDGGLTWGPNERLSDVGSPIELDPNLLPCYHGDYDTSIVTSSGALVAQWSDDRNTIEGRNDPDVWTESSAGGSGFVLASPQPGEPGVDNRWAFTGASGGASVWLVFGNEPGTTPVPGCPGLNVTLGEARPVGSTTADGEGVGAVVRAVPPGASGSFGFQAIDTSACRASNRVIAAF